MKQGSIISARANYQNYFVLRFRLWSSNGLLWCDEVVLWPTKRTRVVRASLAQSGCWSSQSLSFISCFICAFRDRIYCNWTLDNVQFEGLWIESCLVADVVILFAWSGRDVQHSLILDCSVKDRTSKSGMNCPLLVGNLVHKKMSNEAQEVDVCNNFNFFTRLAWWKWSSTRWLIIYELQCLLVAFE